MTLHNDFKILILKVYSTHKYHHSLSFMLLVCTTLRNKKSYGVIFYDSKIRRAKLCLRNMDGCTWVILLNFTIFFLFVVSRIESYSLAKRNFLAKPIICLNCICTNSFGAEYFAFCCERALVNQDLLTNMQYDVTNCAIYIPNKVEISQEWREL